jgi:glycine/D-amino acid oxidase-like deaminating enzyme
MGPDTPRFFKKHFKIGIPIMPLKGYSFEVKTDIPYHHIHLKMPQRGIVSTFLSDGVIRISGFGDASGYDPKIDIKRMDFIKHIASDYYGQDVINTSYNEWNGLRPLTPDDKPIVGFVKGIDNVMINAGHGGRGLT